LFFGHNEKEVVKVDLTAKLHRWLKHFWEEPFFKAELERAQINKRNKVPERMKGE